MKAQLLLKRQLDLWGAVIALAALAPCFFLIVLAIRFDSPGPLLYRKARVGKHGALFSPWKFRSMVDRADSRGLGFNVEEGDVRITRVGRFLRSWGLDELPQLLNVARGEMSLIGPRPMLPEQIALLDDRQKKRLAVRPGMGGLALVKGRNALTWEARIAYDVEYVEHWSLLLDLKLIAQTFWIVLVRRQGLYEEDAGLGDHFNRAFHASDT